MLVIERFDGGPGSHFSNLHFFPARKSGSFIRVDPWQEVLNAFSYTEKKKLGAALFFRLSMLASPLLDIFTRSIICARGLGGQFETLPPISGDNIFSDA
jgi:hypothetical protein